ncbi:MAG TPA: hypothetical protein VF940_11850 [Streptosporangiaceae bacterium]
MKAAEETRWYGYIAVSLLSGLRTEEVRALRWEHVHLDDGPETVSHIDVWRAERAGGDVKTPKSRRSLRLPDLCVEALRKQWDEQQRDRRIAGERWQDHGGVRQHGRHASAVWHTCGVDSASSASGQAYMDGGRQGS